jgi:hypothetical protein
MSDNLLRLIPTDPEYVPPLPAQGNARRALAALFPQAEQIAVRTTPTIEFVDPGGNFERICCPNCGAELDVAWWHAAMDHAYAIGFTRLIVETPCCRWAGSLNDLTYEWPAGFARFVLEARNPNGTLDQDSLIRLSRIVGHDLHVIWTHY